MTIQYPGFSWDDKKIEIIFDSVNDGIYGIDINGNCTFINKAATGLLGYSREECIGKNMHRLLHRKLKNGAPRPKAKGAADQAKDSKEVYVNEHDIFWKADGSPIDVRYSANPINEDGISKGTFIVFTDITEQKQQEAEIAWIKAKQEALIAESIQAERALKDSQEKLLTALNIARLGYWQLQLDRKTLFWSDEVYKIWGLSADTTQLNFNFLLETIPASDQAAFVAEQAAAFAGEKELDLEHRIILPDGSIKWVCEKGNLVKDSNGRPVVLQGTVQDITQQKELELSLEESNRRYHYATRATFDAIWDWDPVKGTLFRGEGFKNIFGYDVQGALPDLSTWLVYVHPEDKENVRTSIYSVIESTETNWTSEYRYRKADGTYAYVVDSGFVIRDETGKAIRMVGAMQDISQRKMYEVALEESNQRFAYAAQAASEAIFEWNINEPRLFTEYRYKELLGYEFPANKASVDFWISKAHPDDYPTISRLRTSIWTDPSQDSWSFDYRYLKADNEYMYVKEKAIILRDEAGTPIRMIGSLQDITRQKELELSLEESNRRYQYATKATFDAIWDWDLVEGTLFWGEGFKNIFGHDVQGLQPDLSTWTAHIHPDDFDNVIKSIYQVIASAETNWTSEYRYQKADGSFAYVVDSGFVVRDETGLAIRMVGAMQDISQSKMHEVALEESNQRFAYAARATSEAIWEWNCSEPQIFKEYGYKDLFGYELPGNKEDISFWASKVHPDDYEHIWNKMLNMRANPALNDWTIEYRFLKAGGEYVFIKEKAILLRDAEGNLLRMIGSMQDITSQKTEERQLKLLESVITNTNDSVMIAEAQPGQNSRIIYVNNAFTRMTGYLPEEAMGKTLSILQGPKSDKTELQRLSNAVRNGQSCEITTINYKKNGQEFWMNFSVSPIVDEKTGITHFIAIQRDITERKKEEVELKLLADDLYKRNKELQQFGYVVSHNLRAPVANIIGITNLLELDHDDPATIERCTSDLKTTVNSLDNVIKDLSKILSITDGTVELIKDNIDLTEILNIVTTDLSEVIKHADAKILLPLKSHWILSHKAYLYSIFYNLLSNAIKYRSAARPVIAVKINSDEEFVKIIVADNGIGIDLKKNFDNLFKPYKRFSLAVEGKGLGLFLVKSHVEAMKGQINVESTIGAGTTFTIILPIV